MKRLITILLLLTLSAFAGTYRNSNGILVDSGTGAIVLTSLPSGDTFTNSRGFRVDGDGRMVVKFDGAQQIEGSLVVGTTEVGGVARNAMAQTPLLPNLGRAPRILLVGESIINSIYLPQEIQAVFPNAVVERKTYGGSQSPLGLLVTAADVQAYTQPGNLLNNSNLNNWGKTDLAVENSTSPTTGLPVYKITANGVGGQKLSGTGGVFVVPAGAPDLLYSVEFEPGTVSDIRLYLRNSTRATDVATCDSSTEFAPDHGKLPHRMYCFATAAGSGYQAGDNVTAYIYAGPQSGNPAGTLYLSNVMVNAGRFASQFHATSGTPEAAGTIAWLTPTEGVRRELYDLVVIQWGANDAGTAAPATFKHALSAMIDGALKFSPRVMVVTPPPKALANLSGWDAADLYQTTGLYAAAKEVTNRHGVFFYDAVSGYSSLVSNGTYTVAQLMRDTVHPTDASISSPGMTQYANAIIAALQNQTEGPQRSFGSGPVARIGGNPTSGTWTPVRLNISASPRYDAASLSIGATTTNYGIGIASANAGDVLTFTNVKGSVIGLIAYANDTSGTVNVSVDGRAAVTINTQSTGVLIPRGYWVMGDLPNENHTVTVTVVSGTARIVAVVGA